MHKKWTSNVHCAGYITLSYDVNSTKTTSFYHFWKSTGFCPPDPKEDIPKFLLSNEQRLNIALLGALPNNGLTHVRIHWLLNLLTHVYNFTYMDVFLSHLNNHDLAPGFELMGSSNQFIKFEKTGEFWRKLVKEIVKRYIVQFGVKRVSRWKFETWNEPDLKSYDILNFTLSEYLDYVVGCSSGLKEAFSGTKSTWKLGGPAGLFRDKDHPLCWGLLEACNGVLGGDSCPLQFLSFHRKGGGSSSGVLDGSFELLDLIRDRFAGLRHMPIANDEADIEKNWSKSLGWRADVRYAAMVVRVVAGYYKSIGERRKLKIEVLSNDNGFVNYHPFYFTQRTLFARFQINTTTPGHDQFIKKPAYSVMSLLSLLGDRHLQEEATPSDPLLTAVATRRGRRRQSFVSVILAYGNETRSDEEAVELINVTLGNIPEGREWKFLVYQLDNVRTNPYQVWKGFGRPVFPDRYQRRKMREVEEPRSLNVPTTIKGPTLNLSLKLTIPSVHLINMCARPKKFPRTVHSVTIFNVTWNEVLVTWKYKGKYANCLRTFEVENQSKCAGTRRRFTRINPSDTIFMSFHHVGKADRACERTRGDYRVRATDYWDRSGAYSGIISYP
ncbi:alpha-L-iduronidase [Anoplophora glabripennis]|uniref:alpha-L-iduronidase n=1 Tax=Anoplophora glabripennis TaxID=217634 RepID=UPI000C779293|nr:alpha-L-iduronidase [Anoplophora glabripennis]